jgi:hypothetical protein
MSLTCAWCLNLGWQPFSMPPLCEKHGKEFQKATDWLIKELNKREDSKEESEHGR